MADDKDVIKDTDADTRDEDQAAKTDEEQTVRDTDADTKDEIDETKRAQEEVDRKLASMGEAIANLTQMVNALVKNGAPTNRSTDAGFASTTEDGRSERKPLDQLDI